MRYRIYPYKQGSRSAKALADALGGKVLKLENSRYRYREGDVVINWGASEPPEFVTHNYEGVDVAACKLNTFRSLQDICSIPQFWTSQDEIPADAYPVVARTVLNGHSGNGIVIVDGPEQRVPAPLYVKYIKKKDEYRVHVLRQSIIAVQRKALRQGFDNPNHQVRNHQNGFVFVRNGVEPPPGLEEQAILAVEALGLDFGAVDLIYNQHYNSVYVLEVNTAPGLEGQTISDYATAIQG